MEGGSARRANRCALSAIWKKSATRKTRRFSASCEAGSCSGKSSVPGGSIGQVGRERLFELRHQGVTAHDEKDIVVATERHQDRRILAGACEIAVARLKAFYRGYQIESEAGLVDASVRAGFNGTLLELRGVVMAHH